jgi:AraC-like DNA-binding protein
MTLYQHLITFTPFYVTLFWGIIFLLNPYRENRARFGLGIFMLTASIIYLSHAAFFTHDYNFYLKIDGLYMFADLLVYPFYYLYIRLLTKDIYFRKCYILHIIPAFILAISFEWVTFTASSETLNTYLSSVVIRNHWPTGATGTLKTMTIIYFVSRIIFGIQSIVYLILSIRLIRKYHQRIANFYSNLQGRKMAWLELLTITLIVAAVASFLLNLLGRHFFEQQNLVLVPSLVFSTLLFIIGFLGNKQNQIIVTLANDENRETGNFAETDNKTQLKEKLQQLMEEEKPYLNAQLRITDLSARLFTNRTYLSHLINSEFKMNFNDFVNKYRVEHAKTIIRADKEDKHSLEYFSEKSGFGSMSSFNRTFKKFEKMSAGTFHNKTRKDS